MLFVEFFFRDGSMSSCQKVIPPASLQDGYAGQGPPMFFSWSHGKHTRTRQVCFPGTVEAPAGPAQQSPAAGAALRPGCRPAGRPPHRRCWAARSAGPPAAIAALRGSPLLRCAPACSVSPPARTSMRATPVSMSGTCHCLRTQRTTRCVRSCLARRPLRSKSCAGTLLSNRMNPYSCRVCIRIIAVLLTLLDCPSESNAWQSEVR